MHLIDGKALAEKIRAEVKQDVTKLGHTPMLAVLLVGDDPASQLYVALKRKAAEEAGIRVDVRTPSPETNDEELIAIIESWNRNADVSAILVQLPLPKGHDEDRVIAAIDPAKDVDGFHPKNIENLLVGNPTIVPPVHEGILRLIAETPLKLSGRRATIIANSEIFATPLRRLLSTAGMFVDVMKPDELDTRTLPESDVIITAVGRLDFLDASIVSPSAVIIDVGTNKTSDGKTRGDVNIESFTNTDVWLTPVPGGVGPMTVAQLLKNVVRLATPPSLPAMPL